MSYELSGTVHSIGETQQFASGFTKREFVIQTDDPKFPQAIKLDAVKHGCDQLDAYKVGDPITVQFNLRGNEYNGKHYVSLAAWKFDRSESRSANQNGAPPPKQDAHNQAKANAYQPQPEAEKDWDTDDTIPF